MIPLGELYTIWSMYVLGYLLLEAPREYVQHGPLVSINRLRLCPQFEAPRPKPCRPQEAIYSLNDSCLYFTQHLFPPKLPHQHTCTIFSIHSPSFILIIYHIQPIFTSFYYETIIPPLLQFLLAGRLLLVFYVRHKVLGNLFSLQCEIFRFFANHAKFNTDYHTKDIKGTLLPD
jgi:hypothetical protein